MAKTLSIIKPDAVAKNLTGLINVMIESSGMKIVAQKLITISNNQAKMFYIEHKDRPFYNDLCTFMSSGPVVVQVLSGGNDVVKVYRDLMGATDPKNAADGTIRKLYASNIDCNAVHGSDSDTSAKREISFFFSEIEIVS